MAEGDGRGRDKIAFAELGARSNFSLLDGASHPEELVQTAAALGLAGLLVCDTNSLAGVVRAPSARACASRSGRGSCLTTAPNTSFGPPTAPPTAA